MPAAIPFVVAGFQAYAAVTATSAIVAGLYTVAAVSTALGAVTKNKDLQRLGAIAGLAGGVGSVMTAGGTAAGAAAGEEATKTVAEQAGATGFENTAADLTSQADKAIANSSAALDAAKTGVQIAEPVNASIAQAGPMGVSPDNGLLSNAMAPKPALDTITTQSAFNSAPQQNMFNTGQMFQNGQQAGSSLLNAPAAEPLSTVNVPPSLSSNMTAPPLPDASTAPAGDGFRMPGGATNAPSNTGTFKADYGLNTASNAGSSLPDAATQNQNWFEKLNGFANKYGKLTEATMGLIGGAANNYSQQKAAESNFNRQKEYQEWLRQRYNDSLRNLTIPGLVLNRNGSNGIINGARG